MIVGKEFTFDAAHFLPNYEGKCANMHGHTYRLRVEVKGHLDVETAMVVDFGDLKRVVKKAVIDEYDHTLLNDKMIFEFSRPTAEVLAQMIFATLHKVWSDDNLPGEIYCVELWETPTSWCRVKKEDVW